MASINFITCHDGFTLYDMVAYNDKHNEANGEYNNDGSNDNHSWNCGWEGESTDPGVNALRIQQMKNAVTILMLSRGVPMILMGDEIGRTQKGNNNAYCQDNEITWLDWDLDDAKKEFLDFVSKLIQIRKTQPVFQRRRFFKGRPIRGVKDITWLAPNGEEMDDTSWDAGFVKCLGVRLAGDRIGDVDDDGDPIIGETLLILLNADHESQPFTLPAHQPDRHWECLSDTADSLTEARFHEGGESYESQGRSLIVFRLRNRHEQAGKALSAEQSEKLLDKGSPSKSH